MNKRDQQLLAEAYQQIEEGIWDRVKARGSQAVGLAKGAKDWGKGAAKGAWGGAVGAAGKGIQKAVDATFEDAPKQNKLLKKAEKLKKAGAADRSVLKTSGQEAKYASYIKNSANTIVNDLNKLGMEVADPDALNNELQKLVSKHLTQVGAQSPVTVTNPPASAAPSPSSSGQAKLGPAFQRQAAPAKKKRPTRTRAQKDESKAPGAAPGKYDAVIAEYERELAAADDPKEKAMLQGLIDTARAMNAA